MSEFSFLGVGLTQADLISREGRCRGNSHWEVQASAVWSDWDVPSVCKWNRSSWALPPSWERPGDGVLPCNCVIMVKGEALRSHKERLLVVGKWTGFISGKYPLRFGETGERKRTIGCPV